MGKIKGTRNNFKTALAVLNIEEYSKETGIMKAGSALKTKTSEHMELQPVQREPDKGFDTPHLKELKTRISHSHGAKLQFISHDLSPC